jgi:hypothetical protein
MIRPRLTLTLKSTIEKRMSTELSLQRALLACDVVIAVGRGFWAGLGRLPFSLGCYSGVIKGAAKHSDPKTAARRILRRPTPSS